MGHYVQCHLRQLRLEDPFLVRSSREVIQKLEEGAWNGAYGFSLDVEDLYYNIPHEELFSAFSALLEKMEEYGEVRLSSIVAGVKSDNFLELLNFYLHSTVVNFEDKFYVQRSGRCIGSSLAPILSEVFLDAFGKRVSKTIRMIFSFVGMSMTISW